MEKLCIVSKNKTRSWLWLRSWTLYCQIQTEIEESEKTTRPFRYDLNQIPYDDTVEVRNRFQGLDLIDRVPVNYGWRFMTLYRRQESRLSPREKKMQKSKMAVWGGLKKSCEKKGSKKLGERKDIPIWIQSSEEKQGEIRQPSSVISAKK